MRKNILALAVAATLSGCSGLTIQWTAVASYSTAEAAPVIRLPQVVAGPATEPGKTVLEAPGVQVLK